MALARLVVCAGPFALALVAYAAAREVIQPESSSSVLLQVGIGLCLSVFGMTNICHDLFCVRKRLARTVRFLVAGGVLAAIAGLSVYVAMTLDQPHPVLARIFTAQLDVVEFPGQQCLSEHRAGWDNQDRQDHNQQSKLWYRLVDSYQLRVGMEPNI